jgi:hypothetical protein
VYEYLSLRVREKYKFRKLENRVLRNKWWLRGAE